MKGIAILAAAGKGSRASADKIWVKIGERTTLEKAAEPFFLSPAVDAVIFVVSEDKIAETYALFEGKTEKKIYVSAGGATRTESVRNALLFLREKYSEKNIVVGVHDGARPFVSEKLVTRCFMTAAETGSAVPVLPCVDSMRRVKDGSNVAVDRSEYVLVQTPQCFLLDRLIDAYDRGEESTDDATLYERLYGAPTLLEGESTNKKITYSSDLSELSGEEKRVGIGFDVHPLAEGYPLILGGITIPFEKGLFGHSDADALTHAVMDALLNAAGLPDIGHYFPPSDPKYAGACSMNLLKIVFGEIKNRGFSVVNLAGMIMAERPKMAPYLLSMEKKLAEMLEISPKFVKIAATTTEKLGIVGEGKGIAAEATVLLCRSKGI